MARSILCAPNVQSSGAKPKADDVHDNATGVIGEITGTLADLKTQAEGLRDHGMSLLRQAAGFNTDISDVTFDADVDGDYALEFASVPDLPSLYRANIDSDDFDDPPRVEFADFKPSTIQDPPTITDLDWPDEPNFEDWATLPADLDIGNLDDIPDPPTITIDTKPLPPLPALNDAGLQDDFDIDYLDIETPEWADIKEPDEGQLDRVKSLQEYKDFDKYDVLIADKGLSTAERLLNLDFVLDLNLLEQGTQTVITSAATKYANRLQSLWVRRGIASPRQGVAAYAAAVSHRAHEEAEQQFAAAQRRWAMRLVPTAIQLCVDAHSFFVEKLGAVLDAEFEALAEQQQAHISLYNQAVLEYRKAVDRIRVSAAKYRQQLMLVQKDIVEYNVFVEEQKYLARYNQIQQTVYAAEEQIKSSELIELDANIQQSKANLRAYAAAMRGVQAKAQAVGAELAQFEAESTKWQADFTRLRADYQIRRSENQAIVAKNRAEASKVSAAGLDVEAVMGEATQAINEVSQWSANLRQQILNLTADGLETDRVNTREGLEYQADVAEYRLQAAKYEASSADSIGRNSAITQSNSILGQLADSVNDSLGRAAELTHQYQTQLAQAATDYANHRAQGEAAQVSGSASSIRASQGLQAREDTRYQSRIAESTDSRESFDSSDSNTCRTIFREMYY